MVSVDYRYRIICDNHFIRWLSKNSSKGQLCTNLMRIKNSSKHNKRVHNIILESESKICLSNKWMKREGLGFCFKITEDPNYLGKHTGLIRTIIYSINLTFEEPFKCYIFTSPENVQEYKDNPHFSSVKSVEVMGGEDAVYIIKKFHEEFLIARDRARALIY